MGANSETVFPGQFTLFPEMEISDAKYTVIPQVPVPDNPAIKRVAVTQTCRPPVIFSRGLR